MADVQIVFVKRAALPSGDPFAPGQVAVFPAKAAADLVREGSAVYYADFSEDMIEAEEERPGSKRLSVRSRKRVEETEQGSTEGESAEG